MLLLVAPLSLDIVELNANLFVMVAADVFVTKSSSVRRSVKGGNISSVWLAKLRTAIGLEWVDTFSSAAVSVGKWVVSEKLLVNTVEGGISVVCQSAVVTASVVIGILGDDGIVDIIVVMLALSLPTFMWSSVDFIIGVKMVVLSEYNSGCFIGL